MSGDPDLRDSLSRAREEIQTGQEQLTTEEAHAVESLLPLFPQYPTLTLQAVVHLHSRRVSTSGDSLAQICADFLLGFDGDDLDLFLVDGALGTSNNPASGPSLPGPSSSAALRTFEAGMRPNLEKLRFSSVDTGQAGSVGASSLAAAPTSTTTMSAVCSSSAPESFELPGFSQSAVPLPNSSGHTCVPDYTIPAPGAAEGYLQKALEASCRDMDADNMMEISDEDKMDASIASLLAASDDDDDGDDNEVDLAAFLGPTVEDKEDDKDDDDSNERQDIDEGENPRTAMSAGHGERASASVKDKIRGLSPLTEGAASLGPEAGDQGREDAGTGLPPDGAGKEARQEATAWRGEHSQTPPQNQSSDDSSQDSLPELDFIHMPHTQAQRESSEAVQPHTENSPLDLTHSAAGIDMKEQKGGKCFTAGTPGTIQLPSTSGVSSKPDPVCKRSAVGLVESVLGRPWGAVSRSVETGEPSSVSSASGITTASRLQQVSSILDTHNTFLKDCSRDIKRTKHHSLKQRLASPAKEKLEPAWDDLPVLSPPKRKHQSPAETGRQSLLDQSLSAPGQGTSSGAFSTAGRAMCLVKGSLSVAPLSHSALTTSCSSLTYLGKKSSTSGAAASILSQGGGDGLPACSYRATLLGRSSSDSDGPKRGSLVAASTVGSGSGECLGKTSPNSSVHRCTASESSTGSSRSLNYMGSTYVPIQTSDASSTVSSMEYLSQTSPSSRLSKCLSGPYGADSSTGVNPLVSCSSRDHADATFPSTSSDNSHSLGNSWLSVPGRTSCDGPRGNYSSDVMSLTSDRLPTYRSKAAMGTVSVHDVSDRADHRTTEPSTSASASSSAEGGVHSSEGSGSGLTRMWDRIAAPSSSSTGRPSASATSGPPVPDTRTNMQKRLDSTFAHLQRLLYDANTMDLRSGNIQGEKPLSASLSTDAGASTIQQLLAKHQSSPRLGSSVTSVPATTTGPTLTGFQSGPAAQPLSAAREKQFLQPRGAEGTSTTAAVCEGTTAHPQAPTFTAGDHLNITNSIFAAHPLPTTPSLPTTPFISAAHPAPTSCGSMSSTAPAEPLDLSVLAYPAPPSLPLPFQPLPLPFQPLDVLAETALSYPAMPRPRPPVLPTRSVIVQPAKLFAPPPVPPPAHPKPLIQPLKLQVPSRMDADPQGQWRALSPETVERDLALILKDSQEEVVVVEEAEMEMMDAPLVDHRPVQPQPLPPPPTVAATTSAATAAHPGLGWAVQTVLEVFPDREREEVEGLLRGFLTEGSLDHALHLTMDRLLQEPPPQAHAVHNPQHPVTVVHVEMADSSKQSRDYFTDYSGQCPYPSGLAADRLSMEFRYVRLDTINAVLRKHNGRYAPTYHCLKRGLDAFMAEQEAAGNQSGSGKKMKDRSKCAFVLKIHEGESSEEALWCHLMKGVRGFSQKKMDVKNPDLCAEINFVSERMKQDKEEVDRKMAWSLLESEYEEQGQFIECGCCFLEQPFENLVQCFEGHLFCCQCLLRYAREAIYGSGKINLVCMTSECPSRFPKSQLVKALPSDVIQKYEERMTEENLNKAAMEDLVRCPSCNMAVVLDTHVQVFQCPNSVCRKETCRKCKADWAEHRGKTCEQVEKKDETKLRTSYEEKMTAARVRTCNSCHAQFFKEEGCNKMTCRCGATMCYICRTPKISYMHFCRHPRDPGHDCTKCNSCSLWSNPEEDEKRAIAEIQKEAQEKRKAEGYTEKKLIGAPDEPAVKRARPN